MFMEVQLLFQKVKLLPNFISQCNRPQTCQFYLFFPALLISGTHKVPQVLILRVGSLSHGNVTAKGLLDRVGRMYLD